jgi:hypothetical protein
MGKLLEPATLLLEKVVAACNHRRGVSLDAMPVFYFSFFGGSSTISFVAEGMSCQTAKPRDCVAADEQVVQLETNSASIPRARVRAVTDGEEEEAG